MTDYDKNNEQVDADFNDVPEVRPDFNHDEMDDEMDVESVVEPEKGFINKLKRRISNFNGKEFKFSSNDGRFVFEFSGADLKSRRGIMSTVRNAIGFFSLGACGLAAGAAMCVGAVLMASAIVLTASVVGVISLLVFGVMDLTKWIKSFGS